MSMKVVKTSPGPGNRTSGTRSKAWTNHQARKTRRMASMLSQRGPRNAASAQARNAEADLFTFRHPRRASRSPRRRPARVAAQHASPPSTRLRPAGAILDNNHDTDAETRRVKSKHLRRLKLE